MPRPRPDDEPARPARERDAAGLPANARPRDRFGAPLPRGEVDQMAHREDPEDIVASLDQALQRAIELFDAQRFFEAHEFLEWIWKHEDVDPADRDFWKGVTQVAVGCVHTQRGNDPGALTLLERASEYLRPYSDRHLGIDVASLRAGALRLAASVRAEGANPRHDFPSLPRA